MKLKEFKNYTKNLDQYTAEEVDRLEVMTFEELDSYQREIEYDSGNLSDWDHIRAVITFRKLLADLSMSNAELHHFKQTTEYVLNKPSLEVLYSQLDVKEDY